jgi:hypothetical protein
MKRSLLYVLLVLEGALCITFSLAKISPGGAFSAAMAFPFEQIGLGLRLLSLTGKLGNSFAFFRHFSCSGSGISVNIT